MQRLIASAIALVLVISAVALAQQPAGEAQGTSQEQQQNQQAPQHHGSSSAAVQSVTGCLVQSNSGYSLKTDTDTYPIETNRDLSKYVNKQIKVSGVLEHHNTAAPATDNNNHIAMTDIRLRMVASVVGDCKPQ